MTGRLRRRKPEPMGLRSAPQIRCPGHLKFVRGFVCSIHDKHECEGGIEAAHCRTGTDGGMGVKPSDYYALPLCAKAHREQHTIGEAAFQARYGIDMKAIAERLARVSPHRSKWQDEAGR